MERKGADYKGVAEEKYSYGRKKAASGYKDADDSDAESKSVASSGQEEELDFAQEKLLDLDVESEWEEIRKRPSIARIQKAVDPRGKKIADGLKINYMNMRCGDSGRMLWQSEKWGKDMFEREQKAVVPKAILQCTSVSREINFSSTEEIKAFRLEQRVFFNGQCLEEWLFAFGFVIPHSTNTWQQTIDAAGPDAMLPADAISGNLTIETGFYDANVLIAKTVYRIYYD
ncbi:hypothetical protein H257_02187 [Aphanomyces astaci]|uniref:GMP phosphodiesterase delta subunit domain-containing protein n=1 Tax=Aphanomyces astaci TaxID=112090 RepID=W4H6L9_APHAT|nr:hypothetical protein H257_02187 [Aphanomyces astaci]ETV87221.1 hypothetical protein H257_02187 [Aphanomyces astaci]|eukprot:XP_009824020.1 hypothetical protein H257_02187 [Aphanomyces astaci]